MNYTFLGKNDSLVYIEREDIFLAGNLDQAVEKTIKSSVEKYSAEDFCVLKLLSSVPGTAMCFELSIALIVCLFCLCVV